MAHPCIHCGSECDCSGDLDDVVVSHTPLDCEGCGCEDFAEDQGWDEDEWEDYDDDWNEEEENGDEDEHAKPHRQE